MSDTERAIAALLASYSPGVRHLATLARALVNETAPDAHEEVDESAKVGGFTFIPGTYKGLILTIAPQKDYVNIIFSKGVELMEVDSEGLLEGTGKRARHIKNRSEEDLQRPGVRALIEAAVARTPRS
jgi:hypothetical protein